MSQETKDKISKVLKGRKLSKEHCKKIGERQLGVKQSEETIRKRVESRKGYKPSEETKKKMSEVQKGRKLTEEHKKKISKANKISHKGLHTGEKSNFWKGGISFNPYSADWTKTLRRSIRERDNYVCKLCGKTQIEEIEDIEKRLSIHHIDYDKNNCNLDNLITLCNKCHITTNSNREYWKNTLMAKFR